MNELVVKLLKADSPLQIQDANHFLAVAATMMQHILTDRARHLQAEYTGGKMQRQDLGSQHGTEDATALHMLIIQEELDLLTQADPLAAGVGKNRCLGYSIEEAGEKLHISRSTAYSLWNFGRAWLLRRFKNISTI